MTRAECRAFALFWLVGAVLGMALRAGYDAIHCCPHEPS